MLIRLGLAAAILAAALVPRAALADGAPVFAARCASCHGPDAAGILGFAPTLTDKAFWSRLGPAAPEYLAGVLLAGLSGRLVAGGETFVGLAMPPQAYLPDGDILAIARFILGELNGLDAALAPERLSALRSNPPSHRALRELRENESWSGR